MTRSFQRLMIAARCLAGTFFQVAKARWAASSAAPASVAPESGTRVISAPVAGSVTSNKAAAVSDHWPPMKLALRIRSAR
ncbi:hypothetical protein FQZ97_1261830 [compost metagenome]